MFDLCLFFHWIRFYAPNATSVWSVIFSPSHLHGHRLISASSNLKICCHHWPIQGVASIYQHLDCTPTGSFRCGLSLVNHHRWIASHCLPSVSIWVRRALHFVQCPNFSNRHPLDRVYAKIHNGPLPCHRTSRWIRHTACFLGSQMRSPCRSVSTLNFQVNANFRWGNRPEFSHHPWLIWFSFRLLSLARHVLNFPTTLWSPIFDNLDRGLPKFCKKKCEGRKQIN